MTTSPIGMLMKNTNGQPMVSVIRPPMAGPSRLDSPNTAPNSPWYLPRSEGAKRSAMTAIAIGNSAPAPRPWIPRAATSCHISCDSPASTEPTMNTPMPNRKIGRRPNRSDSLP